MELELNSLDLNVNELEHELELEDMKRTLVWMCNLKIKCETDSNYNSPHRCRTT